MSDRNRQRALTCGEKRQLAAELRNAGTSFAEIGERLGISAICARDYCIQHARIRAIFPERSYWMELSNRAVVGLVCSSLALRFGDLEARFERLPEIAAAYCEADLLREESIGEVTCAEIGNWLASKGMDFRVPAADVVSIFESTRAREPSPRATRKTARGSRPVRRRRNRTIELPPAGALFTGLN